MARITTSLQPDFPYHVSARCRNREWFTLPMPEVWNIMSDQLYFIHHAYGVRILAFMLMSNHFHLLIRTPNSNLDVAMGWFMRETSRSLTRMSGTINQGYGGRYFRSLVGSNHYYFHAYKYLYLNPVKARMCESTLEYPYGTLGGLLGLHRLSFPVEFDSTLFSDLDGTLKWLSTLPSEESWESVRLALRRREFQFAKIRGKAHPLESELM